MRILKGSEYSYLSLSDFVFFKFIFQEKSLKGFEIDGVHFGILVILSSVQINLLKDR